MAVDPSKISDFAAKFKAADPQVYEQFLRVFDQYVYELTVAVTEAAPGDILVAQGRSQAARKFFQLFTELPQ